LSTGEVRLISETLWLVRGLSAPFAWFQLNLTSDNAPIYHPQRWDEEKLASKRSVSQPSRKGASYTQCLFLQSDGYFELYDPTKHGKFDDGIRVS
jgi:hypothetical protein